MMKEQTAQAVTGRAAGRTPGRRDRAGDTDFQEVVAVAAAYGYELDLAWYALGAAALRLFCDRLAGGHYPRRAAGADPVGCVLRGSGTQAELVLVTAGSSPPALPRIGAHGH